MLPSNGKVDGPGGRPDSLLPFRLTVSTSHTVNKPRQAVMIGGDMSAGRCDASLPTQVALIVKG